MRHRKAHVSIDIIYLAWNRLAFTQITWLALMANTDWDQVRTLRVYDDGSSDGTREWLNEAVKAAPVSASLAHLGWSSPVKTMLHYLSGDTADRFMKVDNDIALPPGWLPAMTTVMDENPDLDLLGVQFGFGEDPGGFDHLDRTWLDAAHIGGVGMMRTGAFRRREEMQAAGRFGFTRWQYHTGPTRGWLTPSLLAPQLDLIPDEPYRTWSNRYIRDGWQRDWGIYATEWRHAWDWLDPYLGERRVAA
jgi:hypothetical protein